MDSAPVSVPSPISVDPRKARAPVVASIPEVELNNAPELVEINKINAEEENLNPTQVDSNESIVVDENSSNINTPQDSMNDVIAATLGELTGVAENVNNIVKNEEMELIAKEDNSDNTISNSTHHVRFEENVIGTGYSTPTEGMKEEEEVPATTDINIHISQPPIASSSKSSKAPVSRVEQLKSVIEKDPWDGEARLALILDAESKGDLERTREAYEEFLKVFPDASQQWIRYADLELSHDLKPQVEAIFGRCLRSSTSVDLWKFYLDYIRRINPTDPTLAGEAGAKSARVLISQSFEFALQHVGQDRKAGDMWFEYINFLKERQAGGGNWEDQQRMDLLRKAYQRAVCIPLDNVELIWQEYNLFENNLNKMTAKKFVAELSPSYMTARKALRELKALFDQLPSPLIPKRPDWKSSNNDRDMIELWKKYLIWEESNPLDLEGVGEVATRVGFAWKKAVASLRFFSEIWYLASTYYLKIGRPDEARIYLTSGMAANPSSLLLAYGLAELEEEAGELTNCHTIYDNLIQHFSSTIATLEENVEKATAAALEAYDEELNVDVSNSEDAESRQKIVEDKDALKVSIKEKSEGEISSAKGAAANVWITQMRFARRAEGIKQARSIFTKSRKSPYLVWQVYDASASIEFYWNNEPKIATNIYELGLKNDLFAQDPDFILQYLDFLIRSNNPNNARALFERTVALIEPEKSKKVWDKMAQYEYQYGDFLAAQKIFTRYSEAFPEESPINRFAQRHGYQGLDEIISQDLGTSIQIDPIQLQIQLQQQLQLQQQQQLPPSNFDSEQHQDQQERQLGSQSPMNNNNNNNLNPSFDQQRKRGPSAEPPRHLGGGNYERSTSVEQFNNNGQQPMNNSNMNNEYAGGRDGIKRAKFNHEPSPGPSNGNPPNAGGWGRMPREEMNNNGYDEPPPQHSEYRGGGGRDGELVRRPPRISERDRGPPRVLYALDPRNREITGALPDAVVFFLSILPGANSFNGPILNPLTVVEVISTTLLPGTAPGGGLPGERLGIPPRPKPAQQAGGQYGGDSPPRRRGGPPPPPSNAGGGRGREADYGYGSRDPAGRSRYN